MKKVTVPKGCEGFMNDHGEYTGIPLLSEYIKAYVAYRESLAKMDESVDKGRGDR